jgi:uncharacterized membrane protein YbhN (UPF0104 family)
MQGETRYTALLLVGLCGLLALGLLGLPVATAILFAFAAALVGIVLCGLGAIVAGHHQAVARRRRRGAERAGAPTSAAPVPASARLRSPA